MVSVCLRLINYEPLKNRSLFKTKEDRTMKSVTTREISLNPMNLAQTFEKARTVARPVMKKL